jgi:glucoamylase
MTQLSYARVQVAVPQTVAADLSPTMLAFMTTNIASNAVVFVDQSGVRSQPGCIIASPSYSGVTDQDYVHHWTRDAAIAATEVARQLPTGASVNQSLCDYVSFSAVCQENAINADHFFRASFKVDGNLRDWSDQKDGPALQSLAFIDAWPVLDDAARRLAKSVAQRNLDETVQNWSNDNEMFGPWEDVRGPSFFARAVQVKFLEEVGSTNALQLTAPAGYDAALTGLRDALATHWDAVKGCYESIPGGIAGDPAFTDVTGFDPNADVVMACLYGCIPCTDPKLLATAGQLRASFDVGGPTAYPINQDDRDTPDRGFGPMIGRYPSDIYDGNVGKDKSKPTRDHPWAICTANFAQLYYLLARAFADGEGPRSDELTGQFFGQLGLADPSIVNDPAQAPAVAQSLRDAGDKMLQAIIFHSDHLRLSEQFDATTGFEKSVSDLTWSYAAYLSATRAR